MDRTIIVQCSPTHTGSTVLVNILHGLICQDKPVVYIDFNQKPGYGIINDLLKNDNICIIKTHICNIDRLKTHLKNYNLYFICSERDDKIIDKKYLSYNNVLVVKYKELLETNNNSIKDIVENITNKLIAVLPSEINLDKEKAIERVINMNDTYKSIKDKPFSYVDKFYHLHGSHRNREK